MAEVDGDNVAGRRNVMKAIAGAGAAAVVWAEPTVKGLARRPAYAAAGSSAVTIPAGSTIAISGNAGGSGTIGGLTFTTVPGSGGPVWSVVVSDESGAGCICTFDADGGVIRLLLDGTREVTTVGGTSGTTNSGNIPGGPDTITFIDSVSITCVPPPP